MKYVLITGSSGGMGTQTVKKLIENGYFVFGIDIKEPIEEYQNFAFFKADVRNEKEIKKVHEKIAKITKELDAIITFAGTYIMDSFLEMEEEDFINMFNTNVFGVYRVVKEFTLMLKEKGKVIIASSELAPLDPLPFTGLYGITKGTLENYAFSLRMELQLLNKQVIIIRPGAVDTEFIKLSTYHINRFTDETKLYSYNAKRFKEIINGVQTKNIPPSKIANLVYKVLGKKNPKYIYKIHRNKGLLILNILPARLQNWIIKKILLSKSKKKPE